MDSNVTFIKGKMNKSVDERLVPPGEYIDAVNVRLGSTETTEIGAVENSKGNTQLTFLEYENSPMPNARCIGSYADGINENIYWFLNDDSNSSSSTGIVDMIVSFNTTTNVTTYHVISNSVLNFNSKYLITSVNLIDNLLFFTDNFNPPRVINTSRDYPYPSAGVDGFTEEEISVIVKPPGFAKYIGGNPPSLKSELAAPILRLRDSSRDSDNYLEDKFLSFAYRYKYKDNQYSATSLFSLAAFQAGDFELDRKTLENIGMLNKFNAVDIKFQSGSELVTQVYLLVKPSNSTVIYVVERYVKEELGWANNEIKEATITSQKILTTLGADELLRQYDAVPYKAQAQTIMSNRLVYGNYTDGKDITNSSGEGISIEYDLTLDTFSTAGGNLKMAFATTYANNIDPANVVTDDQFNILLKNLLIDTGSIPFTGNIPKSTPFYFNWTMFSLPALGGDTANTDFPTGYRVNEGLNFSFETSLITSEAYSWLSLWSSPEFQDMIGFTNFKAIPFSNLGGSLTDKFNTYLKENPPISPVDPLELFVLTETSISGGGSEGFKIRINNGNNSYINVQNLAAKYVNSTTSTVVYVYFQFVIADIFSLNTLSNGATPSTWTFGSAGDRRSLHSNRDYEVGLVYMDDYGRASTVLNSPTNTIRVGPEANSTINKIKANMYSQAPSWASKYKFVLKPSATDYNTIYITKYYADRTEQNLFWLRLEGDDQNIIEPGTRLIVKRDNSGSTTKVSVETILEVKAYATGELGPQNSGSLAGLYASIEPNSFELKIGEFDVLNPEVRVAKTTEGSCYEPALNTVPVLLQSAEAWYDDAGVDTIATIPEGTVIEFEFRIYRKKYGGIGAGDDGGSIDWEWKQRWVSSQFYNSLKEWFEAENIENLVAGTRDAGGRTLTGYYDSTLRSATSQLTSYGCYTYTVGFVNGGNTGQLNIAISAAVPRGGPGIDKRPSRLSMKIVLNRQENLVVFETEPTEADPNIFYDSSEMYDVIKTPTGEYIHEGNLQNQNLNTTPATPAIINLPFFNCFAFGNGVEGMKVADLIQGKSVNLGQRALASSNREFKENDRFASLTYSGVFSSPNNLNNLNEFNLGLVNFKDLEVSFGPVMKLHSRKTDILTLQEDRISYVLASKSALFDATGASTLTSIPEVLGTQIARSEEYGISFNPESFTAWGSSVYFSDTKRGSILKLTGSSIKSDQLEIVSAYGMRSFFRDEFASSITTQKLGGYDPYMDEYVFNTNNISVPRPVEIVECGTVLSQTDTLTSLNVIYTLPNRTGNVKINYEITGTSSDISIVAVWDNNTYTATNVTSTGVLTFDKNKLYPTEVKLEITCNSKSSYNVTVNCPERVTGSVTQVVLASNQDAGKTTHIEYQWSDGFYTSPWERNQIVVNPTNPDSCTFLSNTTGTQSVGMIPHRPPGFGSITIRARVKPEAGDDLVFSETDSKMYVFLRSNLQGGGVATQADWQLPIMSSKAPTTPVYNTGLVPGTTDMFSFEIDEAVQGNVWDFNNGNLFVVWDFRPYVDNFLGYDSNNQPGSCGVSASFTTFYLTSPAMPTAALACALDTSNNGNNLPNAVSLVQTAFTGNGGSTPAVGDIVYADISATQQVLMGPGFYKLTPTNAHPNGRIIEVAQGANSLTGICIQKINC